MATQIFDALTHISLRADNVIGWGPRFTAEDLLVQMDAPRTVLGEAARIDRAIAFPALGLTIPTSGLSFWEQHRYVLESVARYPDRLFGGMVVHARLWCDEVAAQARTMVRDHGFRMIYIHPSVHKYWLPNRTSGPEDESRRIFFPVFEFAREMKLPVLVHTGEQPYAVPATVDYMAEAFPEVPIIIAHMGNQGVIMAIDAFLVAERHENVYLETSYAQFFMLIRAVHTVGAGRVIFGSNCPPLEQTQQLMQVEESLCLPPPNGMSLPAPELRNILGRNVAKLVAGVGR